MTVELGVLGTLQVVAEGVDLTPRPAKERALLAVLAMANGQLVSVDRLSEELWPALDANSAKHALHVRIAELRKTLRPAGPVLRQAPGGYVFDVDDERIDHHRFSMLVSQARIQTSRRDLHGARASLSNALGLWRGEVLADVASTITLDAAARRLSESRIDALEERVEIDLDLGRHHDIVAELDQLVALHPWRERLWRQRILALYRCERQADTLRAAHEVRRRFADELGLQPAPALRALEAAVLDQCPDLHWKPPPTPVALAAPSVQYARAADGVHLAYQVTGDGPVDLVIVPGYISHLDTWWEAYSGKLVRRLASFSRLILFDKRGTGLSDRPSQVGIDQWLADIDTVLDAAGSQHPIVLGMSAGGAIAMRWTALHPRRARAFIVYTCTARTLVASDYPIGWDPPGGLAAIIDHVEAKWGTGVDFERNCPSAADDSAVHASFAAYERKAAGPGAAAAYLNAILNLDVRDALEHIDVPTLVLQPDGDQVIGVEHAHYISEHIDGARLRLLDSDDHLIWFSDAIDEITEAIDAFVADVCRLEAPTGARRVATRGRRGVPFRGCKDDFMFIDVTPEAAATGPLAAYFASQRERWGFLPNYAAAFAPRPEVAAAWAALGEAVSRHIDRRRYELATIAAAHASRSTYCTVAHSTFLRDVCNDEATVRAIVADPTGAGLQPQDRAVYRVRDQGRS